MTIETRTIRARIHGIDGSDEIKKFTAVEKLPTIGAKVIGTNFFYDKSRQLELSKIQRTRDDGLQSGYDFYATSAVDINGRIVGEVYFCVPHERSNTITRKMFNIFFSEATKYNNVDEYIGKMLDHPIWDEEDVSTDGREEWLRSIYIGANTTVGELLKKYNMTQQQFCDYFGVPKRTVENWVYLRQPPPYLLALIEEKLGMISCE